MGLIYTRRFDLEYYTQPNRTMNLLAGNRPELIVMDDLYEDSKPGDRYPVLHVAYLMTLTPEQLHSDPQKYVVKQRMIPASVQMICVYWPLYNRKLGEATDVRFSAS